MDKNFIAEILKTKRKEQNFSVKNVLEKLHDFGIDISEKTLYGWESGHRQPDADMFLVLCQIYGIDSLLGIYQTPPVEKKAPPISDEAFQVGVAYDGASEKDKATVRVVLSLPSDSKPVKEYRFATAAKDGGRRETVLTEENIAAADKAIEDLKNR